jgi:hypothetical protein
LVRPSCIDSPIATKRWRATSSKASGSNSRACGSGANSFARFSPARSAARSRSPADQTWSFRQLHRFTKTSRPKRLRLQTLGLSASPASGISGWTIVTLIALISALEPALWIMLAMGMGVGIAIGIGRVIYRRRHMTKPGADLTTVVLFSHHALK